MCHMVRAHVAMCRHVTHHGVSATKYMHDIKIVFLILKIKKIQINSKKFRKILEKI